MMLYWVASRIVSVTGAFLYPTYASYKTLSKRPTQEADLERWLMYWSVMGCVVGVEYVAEWLIRWIPLYWEIKTVFLLYLALPQTQGATAIYNNRLQPVLKHYEPQIDASVARLRSRAYVFMREKLQELWARLLNQQPGVGQAAGPPTLQNPMGGPLQMASGLLQAYSPMILGAAAAAGAMAPAPAAAGGQVTPGRSRSSSASSTSSFAPTDINLSARKPTVQTRSSGAQIRSRNAPKPSRREQRAADDFEEITHSEMSRVQYLDEEARLRVRMKS
ncbi:TB2/DP1, HVA22 family domain-containing protein [Ceratobasidium sp. AG-Ba]|nr:TB2/DP1, HVA22 family domain-containing protein [Ceratobasidium sp. AG-Ba]